MVSEGHIGYKTWFSLPAACTPCHRHRHFGGRQPRALRGRAQSSGQRGLRPRPRTKPMLRPGPGSPSTCAPGPCFRLFLYSPGAAGLRGCRAAGQGSRCRQTRALTPRSRPLPARLGGEGPPTAPTATPDRCGASSPAVQTAATPGLASPADGGRALKCKGFVALRGAVMACGPKPCVNGKNGFFFFAPKYYRTVWVHFPAEAAAGEGRACRTVARSHGKRSPL